jgi:HAD superfamily hydrolase (TIGR01509 family)
MVLGVPPEHPVPPHRPVEAVLFDFHGTIAQVEDAVEWVVAAAATCGVGLEPGRATSLADRLVTAGRVGGPRPTKVPVHLAEVYAERDLAAQAHRDAYLGLAETVDAGIPGLPEALYERALAAHGWRLYADAIPTMAALHAAGVPVGVVCDTGVDIRGLCEQLGLTPYVDAWVLSCEVGRVKPDPGLFQHACTAVGCEPSAVLMVGDTPVDAAAVDVGCRVLVLPAAPPGAHNGLAAALDLALPGRSESAGR